MDQWLWAVRLFKTRSESTEACRAGHVRVNGAPVKPAAKVHVGDRVTARAHQRERIFEVVALINKRVSAPLAAECLVDHSPPPPPKHEWMPVFRRDPGTGRPTKRGPTPPRRAPFRLSPRRRQEAWSRRATISDHTVALARAGAVAGRPRYLDFTPGNDAAAD